MGLQGPMESFHLLPNAPVHDRAKRRLRQPPASSLQRFVAAAGDPAAHPVQDVRAQPVLREGLDLERLLVFEARVVELEPHPEPLPEEPPNGT